MHWHPLRKRRRRILEKQPFPAEWAALVEHQAPCCRRLSPHERDRLHGLMQVFMHEKSFEGCNGVEVTDEMRLTIAAPACLLLLNLRHNFYQRLSSILIYPDVIAFDPVERGGIAGTVLMGERPVGGLSSSLGAVALSWLDIQRGIRSQGRAGNVILHEFAHQLDILDGSMDGTPPLPNAALHRQWVLTMTAEYTRLRRHLDSGRDTFLGAYAAHSPAEFFAVSTERFFEQPHACAAQHPALYDLLKSYYNQNPAADSTPTPRRLHNLIVPNSSY